MFTLDELTKHFENKLLVLNQTLSFFSGIDEEFPTLFLEVGHAMDAVEEELHFLKFEINKQKQVLLKLHELKASCDKFFGHLQNALANIPARIPSQKKIVTNIVNQQEEQDSLKNSKHVSEKKIIDSYMNFVTVSAFEAVPKYMKGRLQYDKVNAVIEKMNAAFIEKYRILKQKRSSLSEINKKRYANFKSQENKDTRGVHFIVDKDIEEFTSLKIDNTTRNILVILRHCGIMHEIRGGGFVRYASYC